MAQDVVKSKRKFPRRPLKTEAYFHCQGKKYIAEILNISIGGVYLALRDCFGLPAEQVGVEDSTPIFVEIPRLQIRGVCAHVRYTQSSGRPHDISMGVQFNHPHPDIGYRLKYLAASS